MKGIYQVHGHNAIFYFQELAAFYKEQIPPEGSNPVSMKSVIIHA